MKDKADITPNKNKYGGRRIIALTGVVIIVLMYVVVFILAFLDLPQWKNFFIGSIGVTIVVPVIIWVNLYLYDRIIARKKDMEDE